MFLPEILSSWWLPSTCTTLIVFTIAIVTFTKLHEKRSSSRYPFRTLVISLSILALLPTWLSVYNSHQSQTDLLSKISAETQTTAELEKKTAPRGLTDLQKLAFREFLHSSVEKVSLSYVVGQGSGDIGTLLIDMFAAAQAAGATIGSRGMSLGVLSPGVSFALNPTDSDTIARLTTFAQTIGQSFSVSEDKFIVVGDVKINIGSRVDGSL